MPLGPGKGMGAEWLYPYPYPRGTRTANPCGLPIPMPMPNYISFYSVQYLFLMVYSPSHIILSFSTFCLNWQHGTHSENFGCTQRRVCFISRIVQLVLVTCLGNFPIIAAASSRSMTFHAKQLCMHDAKACKSHEHQSQQQPGPHRHPNCTEPVFSICQPTSYMLLATMLRPSGCMV